MQIMNSIVIINNTFKNFSCNLVYKYYNDITVSSILNGKYSNNVSGVQSLILIFLKKTKTKQRYTIVKLPYILELQLGRQKTEEQND